MAILSKSKLLNKIVEAINECGWNVIYISDNHPFKLNVYNQNERYPLKIYIWNLSHGGGYKRPQDEYRVRVKVDKFEKEIGWESLILGWWDEGNVFAGFDFQKHEGVPGYSASIQIKKNALQKAYTNGFSTSDKGNGEIAIAFRPDFFIEYVRNLEALHGFGASLRDLAVLDSVADPALVVNEADIQSVSPERRVVVKSVQQRLRSSSFRSRVLNAYNYRCAFCGLQLDLVQAAHILPVSHERSADKTYNGIAACFLHHAAYDRGIVAFNISYEVLINEEKMDHFVEIRRDGGMANSALISGN
jgi:putative restriction endonuclease